MSEHVPTKCGYVDVTDQSGCQFAELNIERVEHEGKELCIFHLPLGREAKFAQLKTDEQSYTATLFEQLLQQLREDGDVLAKGVHFMDDPFSIISQKPVKSVTLSNCVFFAPVHVRGRHSSMGTVDVSGSTFCREFVSENKIVIEGDLISEKTTFSGPVNIRGPINGALLFDGCKFLNRLDLDVTTPHAVAEFSNVVFSAPSSLRLRRDRLKLTSIKCTDLSIELSNADAEVRFSGEIAQPNVCSFTLAGGQFVAEDVGLEGLGPSGALRLVGNYKALIVRNSDLLTCKLKGIASTVVSVSDSKFAEWSAAGAEIDLLTFDECEADYVEVSRVSGVDLTINRCDFDKVDGLDLKVSNVTFERLRGRNGLDITSESSDHEISVLKILNCELGKLYMCDRLGILNLVHTKVTHKLVAHKVDISRNAELTMDPNLYKDTTIASVATYRNLKRCMEGVRHRQAEGFFQALEKRSERISGVQGKLDSLLAWAYEKFSFYGVSAVRPLVWLVAINLIAVLLYWGRETSWFISLSAAPAFSSLPEAALVAAKQVVAPFYSIRTAPGPSFWLLVYALQSILSLVLIALFLLAVRWKFRRG